ncbi:MAG: hypothetical protein APF80_14945 [Alphaproteobacteria bacterium BRH_c36]|nr:MAG: hypothetical protein APF80_14945 [Alphaproteobacteria bacterium BRH_c36]
MNRYIEITDVAPAPKAAMLAALSAVVQSGRARVFFQGALEADRKAVEHAFWNGYDGNITEGGLALLRLWQLVEVLQSRRLQRLLLQKGFRFIEAAAIAAGELRLNLEWGFMPQRLYWAISAVETARQAEQQPRTRLTPLELAVLPLAA